MPSMEDIMKETTALLQRKQASFKGTKSALAGESPDSMPGAEHDGTPPAGSTEAQPEVADKTMGPKSTRSAEGGGDDSAVTRGHATDATEGEVPPAKALISDDANAKAARCAQFGNDIMADIRKWRKSAAPVQKKADPEPEPEPAVMPPKAKAPKAPAVKKEEKAEEADEKGAAADGLNMELTERVLAKIAAICLSYEDTCQAVTAALEKHAGENQAKEILGFLEQQDAEYTKQAAEAAGYQDGMALINRQIYEQGLAAGKAASAPAVKAAAPKASAQPDAERVQALIELGQKLAGDGIGNIMGALPNEQGAPVGADPAAGGNPGEEFSVEDLAAALDVLVSQKQISPEDAQSIMQTITEEASQTPMSGEGAPIGPATAEPAGEAPAEAGEKPKSPAEEKAENESPAEEAKEKEGKAKK